MCVATKINSIRIVATVSELAEGSLVADDEASKMEFNGQGLHVTLDLFPIRHLHISSTQTKARRRNVLDHDRQLAGL